MADSGTRRPPVLAVDTATDACSVAAGAGGAEAWRHAVAPRGHAARVLAMIDEVLAELGVQVADLGGVAWCHGPGAFTGVRIAAGVAQGIAWAHRLPVIGVSTLAVLAQGAHRRFGATRVRVAMDARMGEVYWGEYALEEASALMRATAADRVCRPEAVPEAGAGEAWGGVGTGWGAYGEILAARCPGPERLDPEALPDARDLIPLARERLERGDVVAARDAVPVYLRDRVTG
ncbi:tRNA (adenosine(37)-N6)-threonylcarbamoyltransferase complex dimerization subunit type 1 TsaB [Aquisalimonas lutea]|uniref:tRNA (adenosine(37)-N6)-threonylcarbamoyltransferase complex dimerization subunit type 1 TsaB n=1 Tax=Aquisalimonas lutea TaxID=1327750 RepID=UPI0025B62789|nr:tRNA (adenosine(37)-N6)-threonylcarbamoyltransferase complex dimerization subunit type 1 TsaB [Aquisalimonas lutea]MDN3519664.1 tRNA (adenosine(37)-N6)-threonylcarbamoyltransferase complex dimerization subunit type 1 TsaB [Aquisalimonas lutea]